jgi:hypothetical protein
MIEIEYNLNDVKPNDPKYNQLPGVNLMTNHLNDSKDRIYNYIQRFKNSNKNDGVAPENILRTLLDCVNLNHLSKNHPHIDLAVTKDMGEIADQYEIISVKSSRRAKNLAVAVSDTKSIKVVSLLSYIIFANYNYQDNIKQTFSARSTWQKALLSMYRSGNRFYTEAIYLVAYYCMFKNSENYKKNFLDDLNVLTSVGNHGLDTAKLKLTDGNFSDYKLRVLKRIQNFGSKVSLGFIYLKETEKNTQCIIEKTGAIELSKYWEKLLTVWNDDNFFEQEIEGEVWVEKKYIDLQRLKRVFNIEGQSLGVKIIINTNDYKPVDKLAGLTEEERDEVIKSDARLRTSKLSVSTKYRHSNFGEYENEVGDYFDKAIDKIRENPPIIKKFNDFLNQI